MDKAFFVLVIIALLVVAIYFVKESGFNLALFSSPAPTVTPTPTPTPIITVSPTTTPSPTVNPTATPTPTVSATPTASPTASPQINRATIIIQNFSFNPPTLTIKASAIIRWVNQDSAPHQIKSTTFNSSVMGQGEAFEARIDSPGTYEYICSLHPSIKGKIIVQ